MLSIRKINIIKNTFKDYEPKLVGIFGSYARNEQVKDSDLDILIDLQKNLNLLELIGIEQDLTEKLGIKVDLVTQRSVNEQLSSYIQKDLFRII